MCNFCVGEKMSNWKECAVTGHILCDFVCHFSDSDNCHVSCACSRLPKRYEYLVTVACELCCDA